MMAFPFSFPGRPTVAVDLGTAFFRIAPEGSGVLTIPTAGMSAKPPVRGGAVADPLTLADILRPILSGARKWGFLGPRVVVGAPSDTRAAERAALIGSLSASGAADIEIVPEPQASAIGAGIDVSSSYAQMVVDVGEGVTDCAILRDGGIIASHAARIGCGTLRERIREALLEKRGVSPGAEEVTKILLSAGVCSPARPSRTPAGAHTLRHLSLTPEELGEILDPVVREILAVPAGLLLKIPHELGGEVIESGIVLAGGGALLPGLRERLEEETDIQVTVSGDPLGAVIAGLRKIAGQSAGETAHAEGGPLP